MTPRQTAERIVAQFCNPIYGRGELLKDAITMAIQEANTAALVKGRTFEQYKLVRDVVVTSPNGEHSTKSTQVIFAEVAFPPETEAEPCVYVALGEWRLAI